MIDWRKSTTSPVVEETKCVVEVEMDKDKIIALWEQHLGAELFAKEVETTMTSDSYVNHVPTMTGGVEASELRRFT